MIEPEEKQAAANAALASTPSPSPTPEEVAANRTRLEAVPKHLRSVAEEFGVELYELVYATGVGQQGFERLMEMANRLRSGEMATAVRVAAEQFNTVGALLLEAKGWTAADIARCNAAICRTMDMKIIVPRASGRIILDS